MYRGLDEEEMPSMADMYDKAIVTASSSKIYSMAGADDQKPRMTIEEINQMAERVGYRAVERDTLYNEINRE
jgi:2-iminoacetate synthase ThiH